MIERYALPQMKKLWSDQIKFEKMLAVEIATCQYYYQQGLISAEEIVAINQATFDLTTVYELDAIYKHDVIAFTRAVGQTLGPEKKWIHYGLTSTDVVDTALALILKDVNVLIKEQLNYLINQIKTKAKKYKNTPCMGRTHGMHAEITSFGLKWCLYYDEMKRNVRRFDQAAKGIVGKLSGAVGNFANTSLDAEEFVMNYLGLGYATISTQVLSRDIIAEYINSLAFIASTMEKIATEIRHLSRSEVAEVSEGFAANQKGSSTMPHKKNPIACENICGCARIVRGFVNVSFENNNLWHERDISHSSAERIMLADASTLVHYMLNRFSKVISNLVVDEEKMLENISLTKGLVFSGQLLSALIVKGLNREEAYDLIQPLCLMAIDKRSDFLDIVLTSTIMNYLSKEEINDIFSLTYYLKNIDLIYKRLELEA